jgi:hypothetical protein
MTRRARFASAVVTWEVALLVMCIVAYEFGLPYQINQLGWKLFGPAEDLYSFSNLILPRLIAWLLYSIPASCIGLYVYRRFGGGEYETYCRRCGYILRGLTEPKCSECGEVI